MHMHRCSTLIWTLLDLISLSLWLLTQYKTAVPISFATAHIALVTQIDHVVRSYYTGPTSWKSSLRTMPERDPGEC
jgi:hypothetical protein